MSNFDLSQESELFQAIEANDFEKVRKIVDVASDKISLINTHGSNIIKGITPLMLAAANGNIEIIDFLMVNGAKLEEAGEDEMTILALAASLGQNTVIAHLLEKYKLSFKATKNSVTPLEAAVNGGHNSTIDLLMPYVKNYKNELIPPEHPPLLFFAIHGGQNHTLDHLIQKYEANIHEKSIDDDPLLICAADLSRFPTVDHLLRHYDIDIEDIAKLTSSQKLHITLFKSLINGDAPLFFHSLTTGNHNLCKNILERSNQDKEALFRWRNQGKTAAQWCFETSNADMLSLLLQHGHPLEITIETDNETLNPSYQLLLTHALLRQKDNPQIQQEYESAKIELNSNFDLFKMVRASAQKSGPYQNHDKQLILEGLIQGNLCAGPGKVELQNVILNLYPKKIKMYHQKHSPKNKQLLFWHLAEGDKEREHFRLLSPYISEFLKLGLNNPFRPYQTRTELLNNVLIYQQNEIEKLREENASLLSHQVNESKKELLLSTDKIKRTQDDQGLAHVPAKRAKLTNK